MKEILGGKGANLAEMTNLGLPVPQGFTITTIACQNYYESAGRIKADIVNEIILNIKKLETNTGKTFGQGKNPLLLSIRSGSPISMPGMMDTILNLGMNEEVANSLIDLTQNPKFVYDSYRRFIMMFSEVVKGFPRDIFESRLEEYKVARNVQKDIDLSAEDLQSLTKDYLKIYEALNKKPFPTDPTRQLLEAVSAVFRSWNNERAIYYRKINNIPNNLGTAVNVQEMVYGNIGTNSGSGVAFTRNPSTGENELYGEYLMNAQGEDVVAGIRTPSPIQNLQIQMPNVYQEFQIYAKRLEMHYKEMQDMEFTIENGKLYLLQTRNGKRAPKAALKIAVDMKEEGLISETEALMKLNPLDLEHILHPNFASIDKLPIAKGLAASPGAAVGNIFFSAKDVILAQNSGLSPILVRMETSPEDIEGMNHARGILTIRGGVTSHAAVVARGMGICCICGCEEIEINIDKKELYLKNGTILREGDLLSLDGNTGNVYLGELPLAENKENLELEKFLTWADSNASIKVHANADTEKDCIMAKKLGAKGIGLCRTEHMFFETNRIFSFRKMILAKTMPERVKYLNELLPFQREDFYKLFKIMTPNSVVIRYLDPPLHEFLPKNEEEKNTLAQALNISKQELEIRIDSLKEFNPMMGHRGCRLAVTYPEIAIMQTKAIMEAVILLNQENKTISPEIMIPLTSDQKEFDYVKKMIEDTANKIMTDHHVKIDYKIGTMIELPRACILADQIATTAEFFSFGTNDLTQLTYGFSRDDSPKFLKEYQNREILEIDPFKTIDQKGVGSLMKVAVEIARQERPNISLGICGEHAGDPESIAFCDEIGLDYVSCSPYRIPIARLAAAQSKIKQSQKKI